VAGVKPVSLVENLPLDKARDGRVIVDPYFSTPALPEVYIIGDCAYLQREPRAETFPPTGQMAVRGGLACARNIARVIRGKPQEPFRYKYKGELISMGRNAAVAQIGRYAFDGFPAWLVWRIYYLAKVMAFKNRLNIALDWSFAYFYQQNTAHLE
jgi:NADH dehydrogenase